MKKKITSLIIAAVLLALGFPAAAAEPAKIGVVLQGGPWSEAVDGLRQGLKDLGYEEGKQFVLDVRDAKGDLKAAEDAARSLEREKAKIIYALASSVAAAVKKATTEVPIVFNVGSDPVAAGLVESFARPGGRLTGLHFLLKDLTGKRLEVLKEIVPNLRSIVIIYDPKNPVARESAELARGEAKRLGLAFAERHVSSVEDLRRAFQGLKPAEADAFFYISDAMIGSQAQWIAETAKAKKLATMFQEQGVVAQGALASYGQNYRQLGRLSAKYAQKVLTGTPPRDLRIETVEDVDLAINLATAKQLGIKIPPNVLARANKVIK